MIFLYFRIELPCVVKMEPYLPKTYLVKRTARGAVDVGGTDPSPLWKDAEVLSDFSYPWEDVTPLRTTFRSLHDDDCLYFRFEVEDPRWHVETGKTDKLEVIDSSRVEMFFRKDEQMSPYYCLELDASGRVLDYQGFFHRQFDYLWSWPADSLRIGAQSSSGGYVVEGAISKASLRKLGLFSKAEDELQVGLFRAECTLTVAPREHMRWISWLTPQSASPDFHIPSAFGLLRLSL